MARLRAAAAQKPPTYSRTLGDLAPAPEDLLSTLEPPTLEDLLAGTWERLLAGEITRCPVCDGEMAPAAKDDRLSYGECGRCGTQLY